jgi:hypothetical protein
MTTAPVMTTTKTMAAAMTMKRGTRRTLSSWFLWRRLKKRPLLTHF